MEVVEYTGKNGKTYKYKKIGERSFGGFTKVKLQSFGANPFEFEVNKSDLFATEREQWTCDCGETWDDCRKCRKDKSEYTETYGRYHKY